KLRVFALAKELNLESKDLLAYCKELGYAGITNQLHGLEPEQVDALKERVKKGGPKHGHSQAYTPVVSGTPPKSIIPPATKLDKPIQTLPKAQPKPVAKFEPAPVAPP